MTSFSYLKSSRLSRADRPFSCGVTSFSYLKSSRLSRADRPFSCGMLGYKLTTSTVYRIISSVKFGKKGTFFKKIISIFYVGFYLRDQRLQMKV